MIDDLVASASKSFKYSSVFFN